ncbi:PhzF family phenazine biosynthesis protein [Pseudomonas syringae group genomosp. 3]|uniref:PhzF family phenazine biosynthesis protein n=1 Tax=Pseudomonas syringae group genomosp. 3 TaxID=251701 RepID=UPI000EFE40F8|nr:PhzF family phenazine biosynthesis protein [Pseudomonas syringae group genomosp. 3]
MKRRSFIVGVASCLGGAAVASDIFESKLVPLTDKKSVPLYLYDSFTTVPFSGNPAPIVVLTSWPADSFLQAFAAEMNHSEVAYILKDSQGWNIRWFTPAKEVPLNGHATLSAAALIFESVEPNATDLTFHTRSSGILGVKRNGTSYLMDFPQDAEPVRTDIPDEVEVDLGVRPSEFWVNNRNVLVFKNAQEVSAIKSKLTKTTAWANGKHVMAVAPGSDGVDYVLRYFAPILDIPEDPVSGVVHCTLVPFFAKRLGKTMFRVNQLSARGGDVVTGLQANGRILIGGPCARYSEGKLYI